MIRYVAITNVEAAYIYTLSFESFFSENSMASGWTCPHNGVLSTVHSKRSHQQVSYNLGIYCVAPPEFNRHYRLLRRGKKKSIERCSCRRFLDASKEYTELEFSVSLVVTLGSNRNRLAFTNLANVSYTNRWSNCFSEPAIFGAKAPVKLCLTSIFGSKQASRLLLVISLFSRDGHTSQSITWVFSRGSPSRATLSFAFDHIISHSIAATKGKRTGIALSLVGKSNHFTLRLYGRKLVFKLHYLIYYNILPNLQNRSARNRSPSYTASYLPLVVGDFRTFFSCILSCTWEEFTLFLTRGP